MLACATQDRLPLAFPNLQYPLTCDDVVEEERARCSIFDLLCTFRIMSRVKPNMVEARSSFVFEYVIHDTYRRNGSSTIPNSFSIWKIGNMGSMIACASGSIFFSVRIAQCSSETD